MGFLLPVRGRLLLLDQTQSGAEEAVQSGTGQRTCTQDGEGFCSVLVLCVQQTDDQSGDNSQTVDDVADQQAGSKQNAQLFLAANPLQNSAGDSPDQQSLSNLEVGAGLDGDNVGLCGGSEQILDRKSVV